MKTAELLQPYHVKQAGAVTRNGVEWLERNRRMVEAWAADHGIEAAIIADAIDSDCGGYVKPPAALPGIQVTAIITCHNYERFMEECLSSLVSSTLRPSRVIVVDDSSDTPLPLATVSLDGMPVEYYRTDYGDPHRARAFALDKVRTKYVLILDADNAVLPDYIRSAVVQLEVDRKAAFVFPVLQAHHSHGADPLFVHNTHNAPEVVHSADIELRNMCDANSVHRTEVLKQSLTMRQHVHADCIAHDWWVARGVLRFGGYHALKSKVPLLYRLHPDQMTAKRNYRGPVRYWVDANVGSEVVTIVVAFSGRWDAWKHLHRWLTTYQTWPVEQIRLLILNSTHTALTAKALGLDDWAGASLQIERVDVGVPHLADEERRRCITVREDVECAVSSLYNRAVIMTAGHEYLLFIEDDVIPQRADAVRALLHSMDSDVVAVSGLYMHRYDGRAVAYKLPSRLACSPLEPMDGPDLQEVVGTGFGCLLIRRSILSKYCLSGDKESMPHYDVELCNALRHRGLRWLLDRRVRCDHLVPKVLPVAVSS